jgi:hypothetical protein
MLTLYVLTIYADQDNAIDPERVQQLMQDAAKLGGATSPIDYVPPVAGGDPVPWGLRIRIEGDD